MAFRLMKVKPHTILTELGKFIVLAAEAVVEYELNYTCRTSVSFTAVRLRILGRV
jgi:hypothetical protein